MSPTHDMLAWVQWMMGRRESRPIFARLERIEAYLIRRMLRDDAA